MEKDKTRGENDEKPGNKKSIETDPIDSDLREVANDGELEGSGVSLKQRLMEVLGYASLTLPTRAMIE